jgi:uncharacterized protein YbjT (DUF2867 family)
MTSSSNSIKNVAIVGATGNVGAYIVSSLLSTGKHHVTALTRKASDNLPSGVDTKTIDYDNPASIKDALVGQEALIISLSGQAPQGTETKLVEAAAEAGVKWVLPNEWSPDTAHDGLLKDVFILGPKSTPESR